MNTLQQSAVNKPTLISRADMPCLMDYLERCKRLGQPVVSMHHRRPLISPEIKNAAWCYLPYITGLEYNYALVY